MDWALLITGGLTGIAALLTVWQVRSAAREARRREREDTARKEQVKQEKVDRESYDRARANYEAAMSRLERDVQRLDHNLEAARQRIRDLENEREADQEERDNLRDANRELRWRVRMLEGALRDSGIAIPTVDGNGQTRKESRNEQD